jgi:hypothetical protein
MIDPSPSQCKCDPERPTMTPLAMLDLARCNAEASTRRSQTQPTHFRSAAYHSVSARLAGTNWVAPTATQPVRAGITDRRAGEHPFRDLPVRDGGGASCASSTASPTNRADHATEAYAVAHRTWIDESLSKHGLLLDVTPNQTRHSPAIGGSSSPAGLPGLRREEMEAEFLA